jgi:hypothetical protein
MRVITGPNHASNLNPLVDEVLQLTLSTSASGFVAARTLATTVHCSALVCRGAHSGFTAFG